MHVCSTTSPVRRLLEKRRRTELMSEVVQDCHAKKRRESLTEATNPCEDGTALTVGVVDPQGSSERTLTPTFPKQVRPLKSRTALMVEVVDPLEGREPTFSLALPTQITPLKYNNVYGTPKRTLKDHSYFRKPERTMSTQTSAADIESPLNHKSKDSPALMELSSPLSSDIEETDQSQDFLPSSSASSSTDMTDVDESKNVDPCDMKKFIVFESALDELFRFCKICGSPIIEQSRYFTGSMVSYCLKCHDGHSYVWKSQPVVRQQPVGNLLIAASILTSGNTFAKLSTFANNLGLQLFTKAVFYRIQKEDLLPVIQDAWEKNRQAAVNEVKRQYTNRELVLSGDARCDSPGHNAKYGSYTLMDSDADKSTGTRKIVSMQLVQVSEVKNSNAMEPEGLRRCLEQVKEDQLKVDFLATDRHITVNSIMKKDYKQIKHQFDIWHVSKGLVKKLSRKAQSKEYEGLNPWIQSVSNHLWWCCATCKGDEQLLREKWLSILHHITNRHSWDGNSKFHRCGHPALSTEDRKTTTWLKPTSKAFTALQGIVGDQFLLKSMGKMTKFCHTGDLEIFHNTLLKFCPKRQHFQYDVMYARLMLAAFEWNNTEVEQQLDKLGLPASAVVYSKRRKLFVLKKLYKKKKSNHMQTLVKRIYNVHKDQIVLSRFH